MKDSPMEHTTRLTSAGRRPAETGHSTRSREAVEKHRAKARKGTHPMKKYIAVITEDDIRQGFEEAVAQLEEDGAIRFPDTEARAEFIDDCVSCEIDKVELYDSDPFAHRPDYAIAVLDMADLYGYTL